MFLNDIWIAYLFEKYVFHCPSYNLPLYELQSCLHILFSDPHNEVDDCLVDGEGHGQQLRSGDAAETLDTENLKMLWNKKEKYYTIQSNLFRMTYEICLI